MKPLRAPGDAAYTVKEYLATAVPGIIIGGAAPTFGLNLPADWTPNGSPDHVGVFDDSGPAYWPVSTRPRIRITVWASGRTRARTVAGLCLGVLLSHRIPGISTVTDPSSPVEAHDGSNGGLMASVSAVVQVRTIAV